MPCRPRAATSVSMFGASPHSAEAAGEAADAGEEDPAASEAVAERAAEQDERGERQRVGVDHPLQAGGAGAEVGTDRGQRDRDDRGVEEGHARPQNGGEQDPPPGRLAVPQVSPAS